MPYVKKYIAVCSPHKDSKDKCWWTCNGGWQYSPEGARAVANQHVGISKLGGQIERIDESEVWED